MRGEEEEGVGRGEVGGVGGGRDVCEKVNIHKFIILKKQTESP